MNQNSLPGYPAQGLTLPAARLPRNPPAAKLFERLLLRGAAAAARVAHLLLAVVLIFGIAYFLGHSLWTAAPKGNDAALHISYAAWIDQYWPDIPHWYPVQGGGISIRHGYPLAAHMLVVMVDRASDMSLTQSYGFIGLLSVPMTALGIYLFCWGALKKQTVGLIAAVFYLVAPISWTWIYDWAFLARNLAIIFVPIGALCFDRYFSRVLAKENSLSRRLWFLALVITIALATISHPIGGAALAGLMVLYSLFSGVTAESGKRRQTFIAAFRATVTAGLVGGLLLAFWAVPVYRYAAVANREGLNVLAPHDVPRYLAEILLGLSTSDPGYIYGGISIPVVVVAFGILGTMLAFFHSRKVLALGATAMLAVFIVLSPSATNFIGTLRPPVSLLFGAGASFMIAMVLVPIVAGFGVWSLAQTIFFPSVLLRRPHSAAEGKVRKAWISMRSGAASLLALVVGIGALFARSELAFANEFNYGYGPEGFSTQQITPESLDPWGWPRPDLSAQDILPKRSEELRSLLPSKEMLRLDVSPYQGQLAQDLSAFSGASQINTYSYQLSLIHAMWGYQQGVFYSDVYGSPRALNDLAEWFGIEYVFLNPDWDPIEKYEAAEWEPVLQEGGIEVRRLPDAPGYASLATRPLVLVISNEEMRTYETVFRLANEGAIPYDEAWLVQGREAVDSYSLEELQRFDALFLHGYTYRSSERAWALLEQYVSQGGALYVDTGWQWTVPEWEFLQAPDVLPVSTLRWTNYGTTDDYRLSVPEMGNEVDIAKFSSLSWENGPWSVSGANLEDVRDWGTVVLSAAGRPLIVAGEYGKGRIVWSGMNLVAHAYDKENEEEIQLLHNLVSWLTAARMPTDHQVAVTRDEPDKIEFDLDLPAGERAALYWREAFYPNWRAYLRTANGTQAALPIYRAGPGFMLMPFTSPGGEARITLVWEDKLIERVANWISPLALFGLVLYVAGASPELHIGEKIRRPWDDWWDEE